MSGGNRGIIFAVGIALIFVALATGAFIPVLTGGYEKHQEVIDNQVRPGEAGHPPEQADFDRAGLPRPTERLISNPQPRDGTDHEKRDLAAQEATAVFTFWMVIVALLQTIVAAIGIIYIRRTIVQGQEALKHARDVSYEELRAHVSFGIATITSLHNGWNIYFPIKNTGKTPAYDFTIRSIGFLMKYPVSRNELDELFCDSWIDDPITIAPQNDRGHVFEFSVNNEQMAEFDNGTMCLIFRLQFSYLTYRGQRIDDCVWDWKAGPSEVAEGTLTRMRSTDYI